MPPVLALPSSPAVYRLQFGSSQRVGIGSLMGGSGCLCAVYTACQNQSGIPETGPRKYSLQILGLGGTASMVAELAV